MLALPQLIKTGAFVFHFNPSQGICTGSTPVTLELSVKRNHRFPANILYHRRGFLAWEPRRGCLPGFAAETRGTEYPGHSGLGTPNGTAPAPDGCSRKWASDWKGMQRDTDWWCRPGVLAPSLVEVSAKQGLKTDETKGYTRLWDTEDRQDQEDSGGALLGRLSGRQSRWGGSSNRKNRIPRGRAQGRGRCLVGGDCSTRFGLKFPEDLPRG